MHDVCVVTVTYGERADFIDKVIKTAFDQGADKLIVIDNASGDKTKKLLKKAEQKYSSRLIVKYLDKNTGSAGGFYLGIKEASKQRNDFIYLLDDDNELENAAIKSLFNLWEKIDEKDKNRKIALHSWREKNNSHFRYIEKDKLSDTDVVSKNLFHFNSFNRFELFSTGNNFIKSLFFKKKNKVKWNTAQVISLPWATYGGLFIHKDMLKVISFPKKDMYLYSDDLEYSLRITQDIMGGKILLTTESRINDLDLEIRKLKNPKFKIKILNYFENYINTVDFIAYYNTRNRLFIERKYLCKNKLYYMINKFISLSVSYFIFYVFFRDQKAKIKLFRKAVRDSKNM